MAKFGEVLQRHGAPLGEVCVDIGQIFGVGRSANQAKRRARLEQHIHPRVLSAHLHQQDAFDEPLGHNLLQSICVFDTVGPEQELIAGSRRGLRGRLHVLEVSFVETTLADRKEEREHAGLLSRERLSHCIRHVPELVHRLFDARSSVLTDGTLAAQRVADRALRNSRESRNVSASGRFAQFR